MVRRVTWDKTDMNDETTGRPRIYAGQQSAMPTITVRLPLWHVRAARRIGCGNASEGIRIALERADAGPDSLPQPRRQEL